MRVSFLSKCMLSTVITAAICTAAISASETSATTSRQLMERVKAIEPTTIDLTPTQSPKAPDALSLNDCLTLAFKHNAGFRSNLQRLVDARRELWVAEQRLALSVSGSAEREKVAGNSSTADALIASTTARWEALNGGAFEATMSSGTQDDLGSVFSQRPSTSVSYDQPILRGFGLASSTAERIRSARTSLASQEMTFYDAYQDLAQRIISDYYAVLLARGEVEIAQRSVDRAKQFYDMNYAKFSGEGLAKSGETWVSQIPEIDVDSARLSWERAKQQLISQQQAAKDTVDTLLLDMGYAPASTPDLTTRIAYMPQEYDETTLIGTALENSTQLGRLALNRQDTEAAVRIAKSQDRPDLIASIGVSDLGQTIGGKTFSSGWFTGLRINMPFWERSRTENIERNQRSLSVLDQQIIAARDQVTQDVQQQIRAAVSSRARIDIGEQSVALARKNREAAQGMYDEGLSDYLRVLDADDRLVQAERSLLQEKVQYFLTTIRVRRVVGEDVTKELPK